MNHSRQDDDDVVIELEWARLRRAARALWLLGYRW
jgi:hypothetical protein